MNGNGSNSAPASQSHALIDRLASFTLVTAGLAMLILAAVQAWQVFARYVLNDSPGWTAPLAALLLSTVMSFGAAAGVHADSHFSFRLLADAAPARVRLGIKRLRLGVVALLGLCLSLWSGVLMIDGMAVAQSGISLPQGASFAPLSLAGLLIVIFAGEQLWRTLRDPAEQH